LSNIHDSIKSLAVPIDSLIKLDNNPRIGDIDAIVASYAEFGQVKPIVVRPNGDGTSTILAGNHQYEAARRLGWDEIAVVPMDADDSRAIAFAIADNRTNELGHTDDSILHSIMGDIIEEYGDLLESLHWDEFELAILDISTDIAEAATPGLYEQPVIEQPSPPSRPSPISDGSIVVSRDKDGEIVLEAGQSSDQTSLVTRGATTGGVSGSTRAVVQYSLVFDSPDQQRRWYDFVKWLRSTPTVDGTTTAERVIDFLEQHADF